MLTEGDPEMSNDASRPQRDPEQRRLIHLLAEDAGDPDSIAGALGIEPEELHRRTRELVDEGVLETPVARVAPAAAGLPVTAFFLVQVAQNIDTYDTIAALIRDVAQVEEAHAVSGRFDWIVKARARSLTDVQGLLTGQLALLPGFVRAETLVVLSTASEQINAQAVLFPDQG